MSINSNDILNFTRNPFALTQKGVQQDFYIDSFYLDEDSPINLNAKLIDFQGNYIQVLNSFIPGNFESMALYYHLDPNQTVQLVSIEDYIIPKVIPILGSGLTHVEYNKLYRSQSISQIGVVNNGGIVFETNNFLSTPILVMLSRELHNLQMPIWKNSSFHYSLTGDISTVGVDAIYSCLHGYSDNVQVSIQLNGTLVNPLQIDFVQYDAVGAEWTDASLNILGVPYNNIISLPQRISNDTRVIFNGGGVGDNMICELTFILSPRV